MLVNKNYDISKWSLTKAMSKMQQTSNIAEEIDKWLQREEFQSLWARGYDKDFIRSWRCQIYLYTSCCDNGFVCRSNYIAKNIFMEDRKIGHNRLTEWQQN